MTSFHLNREITFCVRVRASVHVYVCVKCEVFVYLTFHCLSNKNTLSEDKRDLPFSSGPVADRNIFFCQQKGKFLSFQNITEISDASH